MQHNTITTRARFVDHKSVQHQEGREELGVFLDQCQDEWDMYRGLRAQGYSKQEANRIMACRRVGVVS